MKIFLSGFCATVFLFCFGNNEKAIFVLHTLLWLMLTDLILGVYISLRTKKFSRKNLSDGMIKKVGSLFLVSITYQIEKIGLFSDIINLQMIVLYGYSCFEFLSIIEKMKFLGVYIPEILKKLEKGDHNV